VGLSLIGQPDELPFWHWVRLFAFLLIVMAIVMKNVGRDADD
jgi:hypothetical protein